MKKKTLIAKSVVDKKLAKYLFGKAISLDKGAISSYSSIRPNKENDDFLIEKTCLQKFIIFLKKHILIRPTSMFKLFWDFLSIVCIL